MCTEDISVLIGLLKQIKEQGDVDDSLLEEVDKAIQALERECECKRPFEQFQLVLSVIAKLLAVLPEVRSVFEALSKFLD